MKALKQIKMKGRIMGLVRGRTTSATYNIEFLVTIVWGCKVTNSRRQALYLRCFRGPSSAFVNLHRVPSISFVQNIPEENIAI